MIIAISIIGNILFAVIVGATGFFLFRSAKDGYWGKRGEDVKYLIFDDSEQPSEVGRAFGPLADLQPAPPLAGAPGSQRKHS